MLKYLPCIFDKFVLISKEFWKLFCKKEKNYINVSNYDNFSILMITAFQLL